MEFEGQLRLFEGEIVAIQVQLYHAGPCGWEVRCVGRIDNEPWPTDGAAFYAELTRAEALDVVVAELFALLEL
jgi:hypothetical protein